MKQISVVSLVLFVIAYSNTTYSLMKRGLHHNGVGTNANSKLKPFDFNLIPRFDGVKFPNPVHVHKGTNQNSAGSDSATWESPFLNPEERIKNHEMLLANGSGTRGGGSGVLKKIPNGGFEVLLLDLYRTSDFIKDLPMTEGLAPVDIGANLNQIDPVFLNLNKKQVHPATELTPQTDKEIEAASEQILKEVFNRLKGMFPVLGERLEGAQQELTFIKWTPTSIELPVISDFGVQSPVRQDEVQVQIAYRRATQVIYNQRYYKLMDALHRAALKLHEIVYAISGFDDSADIQIFVRTAFSSVFTNPDSKPFLATLLQNLNLKYLVLSNMTLPAQTELIDQMDFNTQGLCGLIQKMTIQVDPLQLNIQIGYDDRHPRISHPSFLLETYGNDMMTLLTEVPQVHLKKEIVVAGSLAQIFLQSLYSFKFYFSSQFPLYHFPTQTNPSDILCLNEDEQPEFLSSALLYKARANDQEVNEARNEAKYFAAYEAYRQNPSPENELKLELVAQSLAMQRQLHQEQIQKNETVRSMLNLIDTKALAIKTVKFQLD